VPGWKQAVHGQIEAMQRNEFKGMKMHRPYKPVSMDKSD